MIDSRDAFVGIDVAKLKNALAIAEAKPDRARSFGARTVAG